MLVLGSTGVAHAQAPARTLAIGGWGEANEFARCGTLAPVSEITPWTLPTVNVDFGPPGDQVSVELPFLEALENRGTRGLGRFRIHVPRHDLRSDLLR